MKTDQIVAHGHAMKKASRLHGQILASSFSSCSYSLTIDALPLSHLHSHSFSPFSLTYSIQTHTHTHISPIHSSRLLTTCVAAVAR